MFKKYFPLFCLFIIIVIAVVQIFSSSYDYPESYEIQGIDFLIQPDEITCGPTSATMLLNRYGKHVTVHDVEQKTKTQWFVHNGEHIGMTAPDYIPTALKQFGVDAKLTHGNLDQLKSLVSQDKPCIVLVRLDPKLWHFVLVIGYDPDNVIVADPLVGRRVLPVQHFVGAWKHHTDMEGNDMRVACSVCKGTGKILFFPCDICGGSGFQMDFMNQLLFVTDIHPMTLIVPYKSLNEH